MINTIQKKTISFENKGNGYIDWALTTAASYLPRKNPVLKSLIALSTLMIIMIALMQLYLSSKAEKETLYAVEDISDPNDPENTSALKVLSPFLVTWQRNLVDIWVLRAFQLSNTMYMIFSNAPELKRCQDKWVQAFTNAANNHTDSFDTNGLQRLATARLNEVQTPMLLVKQSTSYRPTYSPVPKPLIETMRDSLKNHQSKIPEGEFNLQEFKENIKRFPPETQKMLEALAKSAEKVVHNFFQGTANNFVIRIQILKGAWNYVEPHVHAAMYRETCKEIAILSVSNDDTSGIGTGIPDPNIEFLFPKTPLPGTRVTNIYPCKNENPKPNSDNFTHNGTSWTIFETAFPHSGSLLGKKTPETLRVQLFESIKPLELGMHLLQVLKVRSVAKRIFNMAPYDATNQIIEGN